MKRLLKCSSLALLVCFSTQVYANNAPRMVGTVSGILTGVLDISIQGKTAPFSALSSYYTNELNTLLQKGGKYELVSWEGLSSTCDYERFVGESDLLSVFFSSTLNWTAPRTPELIKKIKQTLKISVKSNNTVVAKYQDPQIGSESVAYKLQCTNDSCLIDDIIDDVGSMKNGIKSCIAKASKQRKEIAEASKQRKK
ncbi:hypothetical protein [Lonepinella sp. BR2474]|uniref:hypothetical protein n=1 Tax=Lonepinella sp. BR2474 TaxID=3434548 RepID=UPI003F6DB971